MSDNESDNEIEMSDDELMMPPVMVQRHVMLPLQQFNNLFNLLRVNNIQNFIDEEKDNDIQHQINLIFNELDSSSDRIDVDGMDAVEQAYLRSIQYDANTYLLIRQTIRLFFEYAGNKVFLG